MNKNFLNQIIDQSAKHWCNHNLPSTERVAYLSLEVAARRCLSFELIRVMQKVAKEVIHGDSLQGGKARG